VIAIEPNRVTQVKTVAADGYRALQVTVGTKRMSLVNKPIAGHYKKANVEVGRGLWEFNLHEGEAVDVKTGDEIKVDLFTVGKLVDVSGTSKGKGFAGTVKRHNFKMQDASHGNSLSHRAAGSVGMCQTPGRVFKGKRLAGQMGNVRRTTQSLEIVRIDVERNLLLVKGAVPGATGGNVIVLPAVKHAEE